MLVFSGVSLTPCATPMLRQDNVWLAVTVKLRRFSEPGAHRDTLLQPMALAFVDPAGLKFVRFNMIRNCLTAGCHAINTSIKASSSLPNTVSQRFFQRFAQFPSVSVSSARPPRGSQA